MWMMKLCQSWLCILTLAVITKIISGVPDKMSGRHSVLCWTFWFPVGHFATWCPANRKLSARHSLPDISSLLTTAGQNVLQCLNSLLDISKSCQTCPAYLAITAFYCNFSHPRPILWSPSVPVARWAHIHRCLSVSPVCLGLWDLHCAKIRLDINILWSIIKN